tara:strand:+ start:221 stop:445 length:225 start_codon:yes stop_codon:yes gene_type:complete
MNKLLSQILDELDLTLYQALHTNLDGYEFQVNQQVSKDEVIILEAYYLNAEMTLYEVIVELLWLEIAPTTITYH